MHQLTFIFLLYNLMLAIILPRHQPQNKDKSGYEKDLVKHYEYILSDSPTHVHWLAKTANNSELIAITERNQFTEGVEAVYGVVKNWKNDTVMIFREKYGSFGEFTNTQKHFFDPHGSTRGFIYYSSYFGSGCSNNDLVRERRVRYYKSGLKEIFHEYQFVDAHQKTMDTLKCDFPYREKFEIFRSLRAYKIANGFK